MSDDTLDGGAPWRALWDGRLRRSSLLIGAAFAIAVGLQLVIDDRFDWAEAALQVLAVEIGVVMTGNPGGPAPSDVALAWSRRLGRRLFGYGAIAALAAMAVLTTLTPPVVALVLAPVIAVTTLGGIAALLGGSLVYWSSPLGRRLNHRSRPTRKSIAVVLGCAVVWATYELVTRAQHSGVWEPARLAGFALLVAGVALVVVDSPASAEERDTP